MKIRSATKKEGAKSQVKTKFNDEGGRGGAGSGGRAGRADGLSGGSPRRNERERERGRMTLWHKRRKIGHVTWQETFGYFALSL